MQNSRYAPRSSERGGMGAAGWLISLVLIPALLIAALLLPPVRLLDRLQALNYTRITSAGGAVRESDGTVVNFPGESVTSSVSAAIQSTPRADFIEGRGSANLYEAARNVPDYLVPKSPFYTIEIRGTEPGMAQLNVPIPNDSLPYETLGMYAWNGSSWQHLPGVVVSGEDTIAANIDFVPENFMVMQTVPAPPAVTAELNVQGQLPQGAVVTYDAKAGLMLRGDGALEGSAPINSGNTLPIIRNWEGQNVRTDLINNLLIDPGQQENQISAVVGTVVENGYPGAVLDYRGIDAVPSARADYVRMVTNLANALHEQGKVLHVRVEPARQISADTWDTGGYDWRGLGAAADKLIVPAPLDPRAYQANGEMDALLTWATGEVERRKLQFEMSGQSVERAGNYLLLKGYQEALQPLLGQVQAESSDGGQINLSLDNPSILQAVTYDEALGMYHYSYVDAQGYERTVYIESAGSLAHKLNILQKYNVRDVILQTPANGDVDPSVWNTLLQFQQGAALPATTGQLSVAYQLIGPDGGVLTQEVRPLQEARVALAAPSVGGELRVDARLVGADGQPLPISKSTAISSAQSRGVAAAEAVADETGAAPTLSTGQIVNVRQGPGTAYSVVGQLTPGLSYTITGKNEAGDWWEVEASGTRGWIIGQLVSTVGDTGQVAVAQNIPEPPVAQAVAVAAAAPAEAPPAEAAAAEAAPAEAAAAPAPAPVVSAPPPAGGGSFGYGIQAHMVDNGQEGMVMQKVNEMGFNWVKQQIEWKRFEASQGAIDFPSMDGIINAANGSGVSVLFSVVNSPGWAREPGFDGSVGGPPADPQTYANFVGAVAGKYCGSSLKAIEVWNEQNLHYEWGNKPLNAGEYVALLAPAYAAIKAACPSMYVISGALTPAGNNGNFAIDDFTYLEQMFQAGLANYADGIGAHPSGYNVPPSYTSDQACAAIQVSGNSFNGACDSPHHSWSFRSTMEGYRNIANVYGAGNKLIWPTEFGWAAGGAFDARYKYADDNDFGEQAQWTVEAYQMMKSWGWVGPAFLWNLNFRVVANGTEKAQWGILDPGWGPLPAFSALQSMPK